MSEENEFDWSKKIVLILDSDSMSRKLLEINFNKVGATVLIINNWHDSALLLLEEKIDLIILEIRMRDDDDCFDAFKKAQSAHENVPIILVSGYDYDYFVKHKSYSNDYNGYPYFVRPLNHIEFLEFSKELLKSVSTSTYLLNKQKK